MPITIKLPVTLKSYVNAQFETPQMCLVSILNSKHVSWKFCMKVLIEVFHREYEDAEAIAHEIVTNGEGFCGGYMLEIAETKSALVEELAKKAGFDISCLIEEV